MRSSSNKYDFIVIGAGGTGLAAAMYAARLGLKTLVLGHSEGTEAPVGGVITTTNIVENYPGFTVISGPELAKRLANHARTYDLVSIKSELAIGIKKSGKEFLVETPKTKYVGKAILFATGTKWRKLPETIKGSREFENKGVSYCALCDAPLYKNKLVAVVGGSDTAAKDALFLSEHAKKVYIIYRGQEIHPEPINLQRVLSKKNIEIVNNTNILSINGKDVVESLTLDNRKRKTLSVDGLFVAIGHIPLSDLARKLGIKLTKEGEIKIDHRTSETNLAGVFAAGDITDKHFKQLITGVADGCTAAHSAYEYLTKKKLRTS